jgi:hypothetical protein
MAEGDLLRAGRTLRGMGHELEEPAEPDQDVKREQKQAARDPSATRWAWGIVIGLALISALCIWRINRANDAPADQSYSATVACEGFVKDRLKAPSTAKFSAESATDNGDKTWTVTGSVDAQNSFGAALRSSFTCMLRDAGTTWRRSTT